MDRPKWADPGQPLNFLFRSPSTQCECAAVWLCDLLLVSHLTAASFRRSPGLGLGGFGSCYSVVHRDGIESSRSICALSAICLCSCCLSRDCLPLADHLRLAFESRFVYNKARYVFVSRRPHLQNLPPSTPVFSRTDSRHRAHREYRHRARSFLTAFVIYSHSPCA